MKTWGERELLALVCNIAGELKSFRFDSMTKTTIIGEMHLRGEYLPLRIKVNQGWRKTPLDVWCDLPWIIRDEDWHCYKDGRLCWVHPDEWRVFFEYNEHWVQHAALYFLRNTHYVLERHMIARIYNIPRWLETWDAYLHGKLAEPQLREWEHEFRRQKAAA